MSGRLSIRFEIGQFAETGRRLGTRRRLLARGAALRTAEFFDLAATAAAAVGPKSHRQLPSTGLRQTLLAPVMHSASGSTRGPHFHSALLKLTMDNILLFNENGLFLCNTLDLRPVRYESISVKVTFH